MASFVKINAMGPDPCDECEDLDGKTVTRQYWRAHTHPNCKCVATPATKKDMTKAERKIAAKANNMENLENKEENLENTEEIQTTKEINEDGSVDVQVAVVGNIVGSDTQGNPVQQNITEESLEAIAKGLNESGEEVLVDADHQSAREGLDRDTRAMGWLSKFWTNAKGLFARLRLTPTGKAAVEGREYRKLSPVFGLDKDGKPTSLESCAFTNTPAMQDIEPILNQKPNEALKMEITKEELIELIKETVGTMMEPKAEETQEEQPVADEKPEEQQDTLEEEKEEEKEEAVCEEPEEEKPEEKEEEKKEEKEEVIKEAALNSMPTKATVGQKPWGNLKGEELLAWAYRNHI